MQASPCGTTRRSRFFLNSFLRLDGFAGPPAVAAPVSCGSLATFPSLNQFRFCGVLACRDFFLRRDCALARTFTRPGIRVRSLAVHRQIAAMAHPSIALRLDEPPDVHLDFFAEIALDAAL